jgi:hypothetical protein
MVPWLQKHVALSLAQANLSTKHLTEVEFAVSSRRCAHTKVRISSVQYVVLVRRHLHHLLVNFSNVGPAGHILSHATREVVLIEVGVQFDRIGVKESTGHGQGPGMLASDRVKFREAGQWRHDPLGALLIDHDVVGTKVPRSRKIATALHDLSELLRFVRHQFAFAVLVGIAYHQWLMENERWRIGAAPAVGGRARRRSAGRRVIGAEES